MGNSTRRRSIRPFDDHSSLTPDQRGAAVANIMAAGILRLQTPAALSDETRELPSPEKPEDSAAPTLEVFGAKPCSVSTTVNGF